MADNNQGVQAFEGAATNKVIGKPLDRVDGRLKVTGGARYAAEFPIQNVTHGVLIMSTIATGRIAGIDTREAERAPGVIAVITHLNAPKLPFLEPKKRPIVDPKVGSYLRVLQDNIVHFSNQPIGVVVADTLERATHAATLVRVSYDKETPATSVEDEMARAFPASEAKDSEGETGKAFDKTRGNPQAIAQAEVRLEHTYTIPREHHNPIEADNESM